MPAEWRLVVDGLVEGARNMARDRAVQLAREEGAVPPTLRLYRWERTTVTLGRFQPVEAVDLLACADYDADVVRRFTGGRGVLHDDELTYSVVASVDDGVPRGVAASYRHLSEALACAYQYLGVNASVTGRDRGSANSAACYLATTRADLSLGATKVSGSAQVWHGSTVLQHGSFTIARDIAREARIFRLDALEESELAGKTATIEGVTGRRPSMSEIEAAVVQAFSDVLGIHLLPGELTADEVRVARGLEKQLLVFGPPGRSRV